MPFTDADVSFLEDEYHTVGDILQGPQPGSSNAEISNEMEGLVTKMKQRETEYRLDAAEQLEDASASNIMEDIKKRSRNERENGNKKMKRRKKASNGYQLQKAKGYTREATLFSC